jgi:hypothetical protein
LLATTEIVGLGMEFRHCSSAPPDINIDLVHAAGSTTKAYEVTQVLRRPTVLHAAIDLGARRACRLHRLSGQQVECDALVDAAAAQFARNASVALLIGSCS